MPNPALELFSPAGPQFRLAGNAAAAAAGDVFIEFAADNTNRFVYGKVGLDVKSASLGYETGSLFFSSVRTGVMKKFMRIGLAEKGNVVIDQQGDSGLVINGDGLTGNPPFKVYGADRGGSAAGTRYCTLLANGENPGIKTNGWITINGGLGTEGDPVPQQICGHSSYMLGIRSDGGIAPTIVAQTNTGPIMLGFDEDATNENAVPVFEIDSVGAVKAAGYTAAGEAGLTTTVTLPSAVVLTFTGGLLTGVAA